MFKKLTRLRGKPERLAWDSFCAEIVKNDQRNKNLLVTKSFWLQNDLDLIRLCCSLAFQLDLLWPQPSTATFSLTSSESIKWNSSRIPTTGETIYSSWRLLVRAHPPHEQRRQLVHFTTHTYVMYNTTARSSYYGTLAEILREEILSRYRN